MKELERHLDVSYPTARARFGGLLRKLGIGRAQPSKSRMALLERLAYGEIEVDDALDLLDEEP